MTQLELLGATEARIEAQSEHVRRLLAALDNRPADWEYRGEVGDAGGMLATCACGHPIRFTFPVYDTGPKALGSRILGSTCIDHYRDYRPDDAARMDAALAALQEQRRQAEREAKAAAAEAAVVAACAEYDRAAAPILAEVAAYCERESWRRFLPDPWYTLAHRVHKPGRLAVRLSAKYRRASDQARRAGELTRGLSELLTWARTNYPGAGL